ncbi:MAG TPA: flagellar export protein FliJ [Rhizobacter sp.]|nr:flagellar export protein FliJ [Rhizobacter sp.]
MTDRSIEPLIALLNQSERERDEALAAAQRAMDAQAAAQMQVDQLVAYRSEYEERFREQFSRKSSVDMLHCYQGFMLRLNQAIDQQRAVTAHATVQHDHARGVLREQELRVASVRKLLDRRLYELRLVADRRDQKQTDEFAARVAWNRLAAAAVTPAS